MHVFYIFLLWCLYISVNEWSDEDYDLNQSGDMPAKSHTIVSFFFYLSYHIQLLQLNNYKKNTFTNNNPLDVIKGKKKQYKNKQSVIIKT